MAGYLCCLCCVLKCLTIEEEAALSSTDNTIFTNVSTSTKNTQREWKTLTGRHKHTLRHTERETQREKHRESQPQLQIHIQTYSNTVPKTHWKTLTNTEPISTPSNTTFINLHTDISLSCVCKHCTIEPNATCNIQWLNPPNFRS